MNAADKIWMHPPGDLTPHLVTPDEEGMLRATGWQPAEAPACDLSSQVSVCDVIQTRPQPEEMPAAAPLPAEAPVRRRGR